MSSAFYFDLASPLAYLAAECILQVLPGPVEWQPILARELPAVAQSRSATPERASAETARRETVPGEAVPVEAVPVEAVSVEAVRPATEAQSAFRADIECRARALDLQPLRWPEPFPFDSARAMRAATYAKSIGRAVPFAQAAFRQAFAGGHSLEPEYVLIAAAACEMHPQAVIRGIELRSVGEQLDAATAEAAAAGVQQVPAVRIGERIFSGAHALAEAAEFRDRLSLRHGGGASPVAAGEVAGEWSASPARDGER